MKAATKKMVQNAISPYVHWDDVYPYIFQKDVPRITSKLLANFSNVYCSIAGNDTECPVFIVKSKKHVPFLKIIIERGI